MGIETVLLGGAMLATGIGAKKSADAQKEAGATNQSINEFNARIDDQNAALVREQARTDEATLRRNAESFKGKQRAGFAASGVDIGVGTPLLVIADTARQAEIEAMTVRNRAEIEATGHTASAQSKRFAGDRALASGKAGASSTILSGAGRLLQMGSGFF